MPEDEEHFEFVDKRGTGSAGDASAGARSDSGQTEAGGSSGEEPDGAGKHPRLAAADRMLMCLDILHQGAWIALGLVEDPNTQKIEKNLTEAKALIDAVAALAENVEAFVDESARRELRNLVTTLRMNFVNQSRRP